MKKLNLLFLLTIVCFGLMAQPISQQEALKSANRFLKSHALIKAGLQLESADLIHTSLTKGQEPNYYVFKLPSLGFIIMSGEKATLPVLGYSSESHFTLNDIPLNLQDMLTGYEDEIAYVRKNNITADKSTLEASAALLDNITNEKAYVSPLLGTIKWNQSPYYNAQCPVYDSYGNRCPVGCAATAMAQILRYWEYPQRGQGSHSYNSSYGTLTANFDTDYDWDAMPKTTLTAPNYQVAKISYHCAVSLNMQFAPGGSGAYQTDVPAALINYFKYPNTVTNRNRSNYSTEQWHSILKNELNNGRPVQYAGHGDGGGHSFVCDGYNTSGYFHFNWGWGGSSDGYFLTNALNPGSLGTGGGSGGFNYYQTIVINFQAPTNPGNDENPPAVPQNLVATAVTSNSAQLGWGAVEEATSYKLAVKADGGEWEYFTTENNYLQLNSLQAATKYYWSVLATNANGNSSNASTVSFTTLEDNNAAPLTVPENLTSVNITDNSAVLQWDAVLDAASYKLAIKENGGEWQYFTTSYSSFYIDGLSAATTYYWSVKAINEDGESEYADVVTFVTEEDGEYPSDYCASAATNATYEWIRYFSLGGMYNDSDNSNGGYSDFTHKVGNVARSNAFKMYFRAGYRYYSYREYWSVWIDFDQSGTFDDDELVLRGNSTATDYLYAYVNIPADAKLGNTRVRISMSDGAYRNACDNFAYGEVEDYTVNITAASMAYAFGEPIEYPHAIEISDAYEELCTISPNPTQDVVRIKVLGLTEGADVKIYNQQGAVVKTFKMLDNDEIIDISELSSGVYILYVDREKAPLTRKIIKY